MCAFLFQLRKKASLQSWAELCKCTQVRLITFNKRRSGEASRMLVSDYLQRPVWKSGGCEAIKQTLNPLEKQLCER